MSALPDLPRDWKQFHVDNLNKIHPEKRQLAIKFLQGYFADAPSTIQEIHLAIEKDPQTWWVDYHLTWGMGVRNLLRRNGFSEVDLGVENLDDCYVALIESAF